MINLPAAMATAQEPVLDKATTLVIVDVQDFYFPGAAADLGYECLVIHDACATRDLVFAGEKVPAAQVHASTLASLGAGYARLLATQEFLELVE
jgi:hypothetical protein